LGSRQHAAFLGDCQMQAQRDPQSYLQKFHLNNQDHAHWNRTFDASVRCTQIDEDLFAARSVSAVLIAIVSFGALLGALAVVLTMFFG
jgi:hypothetical protein